MLSKLLNKVLNKETHLPSLDDVLSITRSKNRVYLGVKEIEVSKIIGSEGRYADFDNNFLPSNDSMKHRLAKIRQLFEEGYPFPPITVYKIDDFYFVRDGNHRVAIAKERKQIYIDAEVTEYFLDVPITQKLTIPEKVLIQEHSNFLEATGLDALGRSAIINMSRAGSYSILLDIIKKFVEVENFKIHNHLTFKEGAAKWYKRVFLPFAEDAYRFDMLHRFPGRTTGDLYVWLQTNWNNIDNISNDEYLSYMVAGGAGLQSDDPINQKELTILKEIYSKNLKVEENFLLNERVALTTLCLIFYINKTNNPKLVIAKRKYHPSEGQWSLPLTMMRYDEEFIDSTNRCQKNVLGLDEPIPLHQFTIKDKRHRHPYGRSIGIGFLGLIYDPTKELKLTAGHVAETLKVVELKHLPEMVYDHNIIVAEAVKYITEILPNQKKCDGFFPSNISLKETFEITECFKKLLATKFKNKEQ